MSNIVNFGFGSDATLIPTLGFGAAGAPAALEPHGRIVRHGKLILWPEWKEEQAALAEEVRITGEMELARIERDRLVGELKQAKSITQHVIERDRLARAILDIQARARAELRRMQRNRMIARHRRLEFTARLKQVRDEQDAEDIQAIAFFIGELYE